MKQIVFLCLFPILVFGQTQIGDDINGESNNNFSGTSVSSSSDGTIIAIGAPNNNNDNGTNSGHTRVYRNIDNIWTQIGEDIDGVDGSRFGTSVSLSADGSILAIGGPNSNNSSSSNTGYVRVYRNINNSWTQIGKNIVFPNTNAIFSESFGSNVKISENGYIIVISDRDRGSVSVFENLGDIWTQIGENIIGEIPVIPIENGLSISDDGNIIAIGTPYVDSGYVSVFENIGDVWTQIGENINGETSGDKSGTSISLSADGSILAIGAPENDDLNNFRIGHVRIYRNVGGNWIQVGEDIDGESPEDRFGSSVSLSSNGNIVAIGAPFSFGNGTSGDVQIYQNINEVWVKMGNDINGDEFDNRFGASLSISSNGSIVAIGAPGNGDNGVVSGHVKIFDLSEILNTNNTKLENNIITYPNPASKMVQIKLNERTVLENILFYDMSGKEVLKSSSTIVDISTLVSGVYSTKIVTNKGVIVKQLIVK